MHYMFFFFCRKMLKLCGEAEDKLAQELINFELQVERDVIEPLFVLAEVRGIWALGGKLGANMRHLRDCAGQCGGAILMSSIGCTGSLSAKGHFCVGFFLRLGWGKVESVRETWEFL